MAIRKAAVIGAGVMGAGIAAQLANAGVEVELLDIVPKGADDRDTVAKGAIERMHKTKPAPLMHKRNAKKIRPGNTEDHLDRLSDCDLIIEAVIENPAIKSALFKKVDAHRKAGSFVASNTSTIPLMDLIADQSEQLKKDFVVTHFFNPPRYMQLLELVTSAHNDKARIAELARFMDERMGKGVVHCHDTPGFIANRIGTFWIECAVTEAYNHKLTVEEADLVGGRPMGIPKTGVFGLMDLVGLDLMPHISKSLLSKLPADDGYAKIHKPHPVIEKMIADGYTGRKGKGGFYRLDAQRNKLAVDLETGAERPARKPKMKAAEKAKKGGLKALVETQDRGGDYAWSVLKQTLCYAAEHAHDIAADIVAVDSAMKMGYAWKYGPFEMLDKIGVDYFIGRLEKEGEKVPPFLKAAQGKSFYRAKDGRLQYMTQDGGYADVKRPDGVLLLSDVKRASKPVKKNMSASLWDIGDGVLCLEFHSKMNALDFLSMRMIHKACDLIEKKGGKYKALVIHNEADNFSLGANIGYAMMAAKAKQFWLVEKMVTSGQEAYRRLKYAAFPVVSAPAGMALGGGCEVLLHSSHVQAHAETYPGLVEVGVGLLPAWGGSTELLTRAQKKQAEGKLPGGPMPPVAAVFETISMAKVGMSAAEAKDLMYLRDTDGVTMNKSRLLADAKAKALDMAKNYVPEQPFDLALPGPSGLAALRLAVDGFYLKGAVTPYDVVVSDRVARVLTGGKEAGPGVLLPQDALRALEVKHFMALVRDNRTLRRIEMTLKGKKRPDVEKVEKAAGTPPVRTLRQDRPGIFARVFGGGKVRGDFDAACKKPCANDNAAAKRDTKPKVNWPKAK